MKRQTMHSFTLIYIDQRQEPYWFLAISQHHLNQIICSLRTTLVLSKNKKAFDEKQSKILHQIQVGKYDRYISTGNSYMSAKWVKREFKIAEYMSRFE